MALEVEDGTGKANAESYVSVSDADAYHAARGNTAWTGEDAAKESALRRGTVYVDAHYRSRFPGQRLNGRDQALMWPRINAEDADGEQIGSDEVPQEIIDATCEAALRELESAGSLLPDLERGGAIKALRAGSVGIEYSGAAPATTTFSAIDAILGPLLGVAQASFVGGAVRG